MTHPTVAMSCRICFGTQKTSWGPCTTCAEPSPLLVRKVLALLQPKHMVFLRAMHHTLANQPVIGDEWDALGQHGFYVEDDDAVWDDDDYFGEHGPLIPATKYWFAGGEAHIAHGEIKMWIHYTPLGLALRECIMAGADAGVRS